MQRNPITFDKRPLWARLGIKKFKRDGDIIYQMGEYEVVENPSDDYPAIYHLKKGSTQFRIRDRKALTQFLTAVFEEDIPFAPLPKEERAKVKALIVEREAAYKRYQELQREIDGIKDGYEDEEDIVT